MRLIKTFVLHLYLDTEASERLCGNLQALPGRKTFPFKNNAELQNLMQCLATEEAKDLPLRTSQDEIEPN